MKHVKTFESYRVNKNRSEIIKEAVLQVNDLYKVKTMVDIPQSLINSYVKKVKETTGNNLRQFFGDVDIAEEIVKYVTLNGTNIDGIPGGALMGGQEEVQAPAQPGQAQTQPGQAQTQPAQIQSQVQPQVQTQVQTQVQPQDQAQVQPQAQLDDLDFTQDDDQVQVQSGQTQVQPGQTQVQPGQAQVQPGQAQVQDEEDEEELPL
jgi:hypothetical protein